MKKIISLLLIMLCFHSFGQGDTILFEKVSDEIKVIGNTTQLKIPIILNFKQADFKNDKIQLFALEDSRKLNLTQDEKRFGKNNDIKPCGQGNDAPFCLKIQPNSEQPEQLVLLPFEGINCPSIGNILIKINGDSITTLNYEYNKSEETSLDKNEPTYQPGYIFYDAMAIVADEKIIDANTKIKILKSYGYRGDSTNMYLKPFYDKNRSDQQNLLTAPLLTTLGNTDVTNFAAGFARFLAQRTKDELNEAFFNKMNEQLNAYPELKTLFPKTSSFLDIIETYSYASVIQVLKEAFETDVQNLPENLYNIKSLKPNNCDNIAICGDKKDTCKSFYDCQSRLEKLSDFFATKDGHWVALGMFSVKEAIQSTNPADLLKSIVLSSEFTDLKASSDTPKTYNDYNIVSTIELSNFISQSLLSKEDNQVWINSTELKSLLNTKGAFEVYLGLLLSFEQREEDKVVIKFYKNENPLKTITFGELLIEAEKKYEVYKPQIVSLIKNSYSVYNTTNNAIKKMIAASDKSVEVEPQALYDYYRTLTSSLKPIVNSPLLESLIKKDIGASYDKIEKYLTPSVDLAYHISTKKYSAAIYDASILLGALNELKVTTLDKKGNPKLDKNQKPIEEKYQGFNPILKSFVKYGTLISTVASAQSSDEVKQALEASVLPVGSYSIKQNSRASFSINSYVGAYYSFSQNESIPVSGLIAPIGFNFSQGLKRSNFFNKYMLMGGYSINLQLLDLGALVNYYLIKGDTASIPNDFNIKLSNIFSPSFSLHYNFKKVPLSIAWGRQYIPTLYKYEQINGVNELTLTNTWRWQVSILVDIPLYNLKVWDFKK